MRSVRLPVWSRDLLIAGSLAFAVAGCGGGGGGGGSSDVGGSSGSGTSPGGASSGGATGGSSSGGAQAHTGGATTGGHATGGTASGSGGSSNGNAGAPPHEVGKCDGLPAANTWENITPTTSTKGTSSVAVDPIHGGTVWVADNIGLSKSTDCGASWTLVSTGTNGDRLHDASLWSIAVDPVDDGTIYLVGGYGPASLWKSTNGGVDWTDLFPAGSEYHTVAQYNFVNNVSMDANDHRHLVVSTHGSCADPYGPSCNAETFDGGATWAITASATGWVEAGGIYVIDAKTWLLSAPFGGIWRTTDNGKTWTHTLDGYGGAGEFTNQPLVPATDGAYYFSSATQGVLRSADGGKTFTRLMTDGRSVGFAMNATTLFVAEQDAPRFRRAAIGKPDTWTDMPKPSDLGSDRGAPFLSYDVDHKLLYASSWQYGLHRIVVE